MEENKVVEQEREEFDLRTHVRDGKTGQVLKHQPYRRLVIDKIGVFYLRDGKIFTENSKIALDNPPAEVLKGFDLVKESAAQPKRV